MPAPPIRHSGLRAKTGRVSRHVCWGLDNLRASKPASQQDSEPCEADVRGTQVSLKSTQVSLNSSPVSLTISIYVGGCSCLACLACFVYASHASHVCLACLAGSHVVHTLFVVVYISPTAYFQKLLHDVSSLVARKDNSVFEIPICLPLLVHFPF